MYKFNNNYLVKRTNWQSGQALLIVVLVMVVALTVGLSVAVRTTTNLRTSSESESSQRAFSAAEAGIEQSLQSGASVSVTSLDNNSTYQSTVSNLSGGSFNLNNGTEVFKDEPIDLWLSDYPSYNNPWSGSLSINWGSASDVCNPDEGVNTEPALEIVIISGTLANPRTTSYLLDSCAARASSNNFKLVSTTGDVINGVSYANKETISVLSGLIARIIPLYASTYVGAQKGSADPDLPSQGIVVTSTGTSDNTKRKIISFQEHPKLPSELFPFVLFLQK